MTFPIKLLDRSNDLLKFLCAPKVVFDIVASPGYIHENLFPNLSLREVEDIMCFVANYRPADPVVYSGVFYLEKNNRTQKFLDSGGFNISMAEGILRDSTKGLFTKLIEEERRLI